MIVVITEGAPERLRGRLALWLLEPRAGVYVGVFSKRTRTMLWEEVLKGLDGGNAVMAWTDSNEAGFSFVTAGPNRRLPSELDGRPSVRFHPPPAVDHDGDWEDPPDPQEESIELALALSAWHSGKQGTLPLDEPVWEDDGWDD